MNKELAPDTTLAHYRIVSNIGAGGMGEVYLAQDTKLDRKAALKILPAELAANQDRMRRFVQEAKAAAALNHPNIAHIYEIGESDGTNFIAMEFIDGKTLREKIHGEKSSLKVLVKHMQQVAEGLAKAHASGIVHRDLKPDNIMITHEGHAKILDFGLAKLIETTPESAPEVGEAATAMMPVQHSTPGVVMGTVGYMSPEQAQAKPVDQRSDIFSFGCILYETATGRKPFAGDSIVDTLHKVIHEPAPAITDFNPSASPELQRVIRKCLAKEPERRYQTIRDTANDLEELLEEMKGVSDSERSVAPSTGASSSSAPGITKAELPALSTASVTHPPASSAEYVITGIKRHKLSVLIALAVLVVAAVGLGLYLSAGKTAVAIESIAVMPFINESGNADVEYLSDGMTETLIKSLSQLPNLAVKSRSTVFYYKGKETSPKKIGEELNVQAVLLGRVVQRGDELKLSLELVNTQTQDVIWSEQYDRKKSDLVSLQSEIAKEVSTKLKLKLSGADEAKVIKTSTADPEAYQSYLKGRYFWNRRTSENLKKAIAQFKIATDRDPNYALAFAGLADCYALLNEYSGVPVTEAAPQARSYAERAIAIDESLAEPHATLGTINKQLWQWAEAEKEFRRAIALNPNYATAYHWYSIMLLYLGRYDESLAMIQRARELDPMSSIITAAFSWVQLMRGNHQVSTDTLLKLIELDPNFGFAYDNLGLSYLKTRRNAEAVAALEKSAQLTDRYGFVLGNLGYAYAVTGKRTEALAIINELEEKYTRKQANGLSVAAVYAGLGDKDKAFEWLEKDFQNRDGLLPDITVSIPLESLRDDPRFKHLLKRMNLPE